ncbi:unannotated protein [freshwater metagenome]|uniref:Unannotated protein n=1 Tax=freshwater metagenome TaxID=449393 RepID=A0A6J6GNB8_9ZZZZ|nr:hypothetical protein [Actinomycetota bacterium]
MLEPIVLIGIAGLCQVILGLVKPASLLMAVLLSISSFFGLAQIATLTDLLLGSTISIGINPNIAGYIFLISAIVLPDSFEINGSVYKSNYLRIAIMALCVSTGSALTIILLALWLITKIRLKLWQIFLIVAAALVLSPLYIEALQRSALIRLEIWKTAINISEANGWSGIGPYGFSDSFAKFRTLEFVKLKSVDTLINDPHNIFLNVLLSDGIFFALLFALLVCVVYFKLVSSTEISQNRKLGLTFTLIFLSANVLSLLVVLVSLLALNRDFRSDSNNIRTS